MSENTLKRRWRVWIFCLNLCFAPVSFEMIAESSELEDKEAKGRERAIAVLRNALQEGSQWEKVHAAEALLWNGYPENVKATFEADLASAAPPYRIGVWRVLAKSQGNDETAARRYAQRIRDAFLDPLASDRDYALEALAKLQFSEPLFEVVRVAREGKGAFRAHARWVLANSGNSKEEATLAELLGSAEPGVRASAAYALRHLKRLQSSTLDKLETAVVQEPPDSKAKVYELGALYVHSNNSRREALKGNLVEYASNGAKEQKVELCAVLGAAGNKAEIPLLERLLGDEELDVRISAANGLLRIERRQHRGLSGLDWAIMALYGAAMLGVGWMASRRQKSSEEYFVAGRTMKPFMIGIALFSAILSPISYLAHPGEMIKHGPVVLCGLIALPIVYVVVGYGLIPFFMRLPITSAYEILEDRLGVSIRLLGSTIFTLTRLVWMSLLIYLTARSMVVILGWAPEMIPYVVTVAGLVTVVYTVMGGLRGVVVTNAIQFFIQIGGAILTIVLINQRLGGVEAWFPTSWASSWDAQPFFSLDPFVRATVVGAILNSVVFWTCVAGSDQMAIQRYLATRNEAAARRAFLINLIASSVVLIILALLGFALLGFFRANPHLIFDGRSLIEDADFLFPHYLANYLPVGVAGLVLVGIFADAMSSLSSALNSISSVFIVDFLGHFRKHKDSAHSQVSVARYLTLVIGVVVVLTSSVMDKVPGNLQEVAVKTSALFMVPLFVLFFMALFVPFATPLGTAIGASYSFVAAALFSFWDVFTGQPRLSFQWISVVAFLAGVTCGPLASLVPMQRRWLALAVWSLLLGASVMTIYYIVG